MKHKIIGILLLLGSFSATGVESIYVGGAIGHVGLTGDASRFFTNGIGFGLDLGIRTNPLLQVDFSSQISPHGGDLTLFSETFGANFHFYELSDIDLSAGGGPGFYFFKTAGTPNSYFGINIGGAADVVMAEAFRLGLGFRYHGLFGNAPGSYWTVMMRFGYSFEVDS